MAFIFGEGTPWTQADLERKRELIASLDGQLTRAPRNAGEGLTAIGNALAARNLERRASKRDGELQAEYDAQFDSVLGGLGGGLARPLASGHTPVRSAPAPAAGEGQAVADDAMLALGREPIPQRDPASWLRYANQGATRDDPLSPELVSALSFLPEMGIEMEVFSGGQENNTTHGLGSTRHNHGNAADVFFSRNGERLDWSNPEHLPIFQDIVAKARQNGVTGVGAGEGYMRPGSMHIGFGNEAVWGAGGRGANAPEWLRTAFNGGAPSERPTQPRAAQSPQPTMSARGADGSPMAAVMQLANLASNPRATAGQKAVLNSLIGQQMSSMQPQSERETLELEMLRAQVERAQSPQQGYRMLSPQEIEQNRLDPAKGWQIGPDGKVAQVGGGGVTVNTGDQGQAIGTIPQGYAVVEDPNNPSGWRLEPIPGGPADTTNSDIIAQEGRERAGGVVTEDIGRALEIIQRNPSWTTGVGAFLSGVPGTEAKTLSGILQTIKANTGFDRLQAMRDASPTGGALGAINKSEMDLLQSVYGNLEQSQDDEELIFNLERLNRIYLDIVHGDSGPEAESDLPTYNPQTGQWE